MRRRLMMLLAIFASFALLAAACGDGDPVAEDTAAPAPVDDDDADDPVGDEEVEEAAAPKETLSVSYGGPTTLMGPGQAPFASLPDALGYWEEEGLDVEVLGFTAAGDVVDAVDAGQLDVGLGGTGSLLPAVAAGVNMIAYYTERTRNFRNPMVPPESPITEIADLEGTTIGVVGLGSAAVPLLKAMVDRVGGDPDSIEFVATGAGPDALEQLRAGRVDVLGLWDSAHAQIMALGQELRPVTDDFFDNLGFVQPLFAKPEMLESEEGRRILVGVARGLAKATLFATENPEAAVRIHWEAHPESIPTGVPEDEALEQAVLVLSTHLEKAQPIDGVWGWATTQQIQDQIETLQRGGVLASDVGIDQFWTDELLDEINDFDGDAVRGAARNGSG
jgi:NitT/TauT family transport system substrate-binding protein